MGEHSTLRSWCQRFKDSYEQTFTMSVPEGSSTPREESPTPSVDLYYGEDIIDEMLRSNDSPLHGFSEPWNSTEGQGRYDQHIGGHHGGMDLDARTIVPFDSEANVTPREFPVEEVRRETNQANPPPELEVCECGQGCLRCQAGQIVVSQPSSFISRTFPSTLTVQEEKKKEPPLGKEWRIVSSAALMYKKVADILRRIRFRRTASAAITPGTPTRLLPPNNRVPKKYIGVTPRKNKWVSEIRIQNTTEKVWLGSFCEEKEAALAYDVGVHFCSKKKLYNFTSSPGLLGPRERLNHLSLQFRKPIIQSLAGQHARCYSTKNIE